MSRRILLALIAGLITLAGAVTAVVVTDPWGWRNQPVNAEASATPSPTASLSKDAEDAAAALAKLATDPVSVASKDMKTRVNAAEAVPPGSIIDPKPETWAPDGLRGGTMTVGLTSPGEPQLLFKVLMDKEDDGWKVSMTWPIEKSATSVRQN